MAGGGALRWLKWLVALVVLAGASYWGYRWLRQRARPENGSPYQTATVTRGDLTQVVTATGQINPVINVQVGSQISGIIQKLFVDYNDRVTNGQVIAQIDPATYQANLQQGLAELANALAQLELAAVNERRSKELLANRLIPQSDYDQVVATLHHAEAQVAIKSAAVMRAQTDLARCTIYSPIDGVVIDRKVDVGQTVAASLSAPTLFVIANDLRDMQIEANVAEADVGLVKVGMPVNFTVDAFPYETFTGVVVQVRNAPIMVQNVVTYDTIIKVDNRELKLKPGMTANVSILVAERKNALRIPNAALRVRLTQDGKKTTSASTPSLEKRESAKRNTRGARREDRVPWRTVYVLPKEPGADGKRTPQPVKIRTGISDGVFTEVLEGVEEGDEVITFVRTAEKPAGLTPVPLPGIRRF
ncbi:MAG: efflux RND transporter periplasmic adaptor subunit [Verrucomicrobiae bacterium]|nr:efflux RND transporter periplasmic adaptor subunit [Verrucomicrobiae bacterium]